MHFKIYNSRIHSYMLDDKILAPVWESSSYIPRIVTLTYLVTLLHTRIYKVRITRASAKVLCSHGESSFYIHTSYGCSWICWCQIKIQCKFITSWYKVKACVVPRNSFNTQLSVCCLWKSLVYHPIVHISMFKSITIISFTYIN